MQASLNNSAISDLPENGFTQWDVLCGMLQQLCFVNTATVTYHKQTNIMA